MKKKHLFLVSVLILTTFSYLSGGNCYTCIEDNQCESVSKGTGQSACVEVHMGTDTCTLHGDACSKAI